MPVSEAIKIQTIHTPNSLLVFFHQKSHFSLDELGPQKSLLETSLQVKFKTEKGAHCTWSYVFAIWNQWIIVGLWLFVHARHFSFYFKLVCGWLTWQKFQPSPGRHSKQEWFPYQSNVARETNTFSLGLSLV